MKKIDKTEKTILFQNGRNADSQLEFKEPTFEGIEKYVFTKASFDLNLLGMLHLKNHQISYRRDES